MSWGYIWNRRTRRAITLRWEGDCPMTLATGSTTGTSVHHITDAAEPQSFRDPELAELVARRTAQLRQARALGKPDGWTLSDDYWGLQLGRRGGSLGR